MPALAVALSVSLAAQAPQARLPHRAPSTLRASIPLGAPPAAPPIIADGHVVVPLLGGTIVAHRLEDGTEAWRAELVSDQQPGAGNGLVFVAAGDAIHALRTTDGAVGWRAATGALTAPVLVQADWIIAATASEWMALRASDGSVVWRRPGTPLSGQPALHGDRLYLPLADGRLLALDVKTGQDRWSRRLGGPPSGILAMAEHVYVGSADRHFYRVDAATGSIDWGYRVGAVMRGAPAAHGPHVYTVALDNLVRAFDLGHGARRWSKGIAFRAFAGPMVAGGDLIIPGPAAVLPVFDAATGTAAMRIPLPATLAMAPALGEHAGELVLAAVVGNISSGWTLVIFDSSYSIPLAPLTTMPGEVIPLTTLWPTLRGGLVP